MYQKTKYKDMLERAGGRIDEIKKLQEAGFICHDRDFVPSPLFTITQYPPITEEEMFADYTLPNDGLLDIYVHIPFCERRLQRI